jgi:hypothetical protein
MVPKGPESLAIRDDRGKRAAETPGSVLAPGVEGESGDLSGIDGLAFPLNPQRSRQLAGIIEEPVKPHE